MPSTDSRSSRLGSQSTYMPSVRCCATGVARFDIEIAVRAEHSADCSVDLINGSQNRRVRRIRR